MALVVSGDDIYLLRVWLLRGFQGSVSWRHLQWKRQILRDPSSFWYRLHIYNEGGTLGWPRFSSLQRRIRRWTRIILSGGSSEQVPRGANESEKPFQGVVICTDGELSGYDIRAGHKYVPYYGEEFAYDGFIVVVVVERLAEVSNWSKWIVILSF